MGSDSRTGEEMLPNREGSGNSPLHIQTILCLPLGQGMKQNAVCPGVRPPGAGGSVLWTRGPSLHSLKSTDARKKPENAAATCKLVPQTLQETCFHKQGTDSQRPTSVMLAAEAGIFTTILGMERHGYKWPQMPSSLQLQTSPTLFGRDRSHKWLTTT